MKKVFLFLVISVFFTIVLLSCATAPAGTSFMDADAASGSTLRVARGVTIRTFAGQDVNWAATYSLFGGWQTAEFYVPQGLQTFTASSGLLTREFNIAFAPGRRYLIRMNLSGTDFVFEEL